MSQPRVLKLPHVVKEGFIHKEGHNIRKMKKRFFKLIIDMDCHPVLEYFDELDTTRRLGLCNLSACTLNKPKNMRPPFMHCLRIDLIDHAMNSFVKLVLGWETQADHDEWVKAFKTASTLITAHRSGSLGVQTSSAEQLSNSSSPAVEVRASVAEVMSSTSHQHTATASSPQSASVSATSSASEPQSGASPSPGGSTKAYQRRGSITVGNIAAAEKREAEKADAEAEKRALLEKVNGLASADIQKLIDETARNLQIVSSEERFNPRKQALEDVLAVFKDRLDQALHTEKLIEEQISRMSVACEDELKKFNVDDSLPANQRIEIQNQLQRYLSRLEGELHDAKSADSPSSKIIRAYESSIQSVSTRVEQLAQCEQLVEAKVNNSKDAKMKFITSMDSCSMEEAVRLKAQNQHLLSQETNPEVRGILTEIVDLFVEKLAAEERLDREACQLVDTGANLKKYARDKVIKKSRHDPVPSVVKCVSGALLWGSHKTGPKIHNVERGPSDLLKSSGILGPRSVKVYDLCCRFVLLTPSFSPNEKLHLHISVSDGSSNAAGREIIDFVNRRNERVAQM
jgi:hypothetical protein